MKEAQAIERLREVLRRQHKALATEDSYVLWLRRYIKALPKMPPGVSSEKKLEIFLTDLARVHDPSASTQNQAFNAIVFFQSLNSRSKCNWQGWCGNGINAMPCAISNVAPERLHHRQTTLVKPNIMDHRALDTPVRAPSR